MGSKRMMSKKILPYDPKQSRAVIIGVSKYPCEEDSGGLTDVKSIKNNFHSIVNVLKNDDIIGIPKERIEEYLDEGTPVVICPKIGGTNGNSEGLLLVYYCGHGLIHRHKPNELLLATCKSTNRQAELNSLEYSKIREALAGAKEKIRIVILDCCFSGLAANPFLSNESLPAKIEGALVLCATNRHERAWAPPEEKYTAFTGILLKCLEEGLERCGPTLSFEDIYKEIAMKSDSIKNMPCPQMLSENVLSAQAFCKNVYHQKRVNGIKRRGSREPAKPRMLLVKVAQPYPIRNHDFGVPLGLWTIKSELSYSGYNVDIFDERLHIMRGTEDKCEWYMDKYDVVGVSACTSEIPNALKCLKLAKDREKVTVIGGIAAFSNEKYFLSHNYVDYVIPGVATKPLKQLLERGATIKPHIEDIAGLFCKNNCSKMAGNIWQTDTIPSIKDRLLSNIHKEYGDFLNGKIDIVSSRGCHFRCDYCSIHKETGGAACTRNDKDVIDEIQFWAEKNYDYISIKDENFPFEFERSVDILTKAREQTDGNLRFKIRSRIDTLGDSGERLEKLAELGVKEIQFGVETISGTLMTIIHKGMRWEGHRVMKFLQKVMSYGITVNSSFILGLSGEDENYYEELIDFINTLSQKPDLLKVYINFYTPHPFRNKWPKDVQGQVVNNKLERFTHKNPVFASNSHELTSEKQKMIDTYEEISSISESRKYNPPIPKEIYDDYLDSDGSNTSPNLPDYKYEEV